MKWITASDITNWANANQRVAQQLMPELVRRLIFATTELKDIMEISFPSGDAVAQGGWDGRLSVSTESPFFPGGQSGWEIGTSQSPGTKAEEDYKKRTTDPIDLEPSRSTFVFVTSRPWPNRSQWVSKRKNAGQWKDIRVIGANELEGWLDMAPSVALWFARKMGMPIPAGIQDIQSFWKEWACCTDPELTSTLVIGGRVNEVDQVHEWIDGAPDVHRLQGDSPDEAIAFLYTSLDEMQEPQREAALSRAIVLQEPAVFRELIETFRMPLVIAATSNCSGVAARGVNAGHHVFLSVDSNLTNLGDDTRLSRPRRDVVRKVLIKSGMAKSEAESSVKDFGRSLPTLRRHLSVVQSVTTPEWAKPEFADTMLPILFVGAWNDAKSGDRDVISEISSVDYIQFAKKLPQLLAMSDSPIRRIGNVWTLESHVDTWFLVARHVSKDFLENALEVISSTIGERDPRFDLSDENRWAAGMHGKDRAQSGFLRRGLAESLVLLSIYGDRLSSVESAAGHSIVCVRIILDSLKDWQVMASVQDVLPLLAEAAPQAFLTKIEQRIIDDPQLFINLLTDEGSAIFGQCNHSGLLWAIESVAWSSEFFSQAIDVLERLAEIDPGGRWANRPINSLKDIFHPSRPQTHAFPEERLAAYDRLRKSHPSLTWQLTKEYFTGGFISESHRLRWRDSGGERHGLEPESEENYLKYVAGLDSMIQEVACDSQNIVASTADLLRLPGHLQMAVIQTLESCDVGSMDREDLLSLNANIRDALNWIHSYGKEEHKELGQKLASVLKGLSVDNVLDRVGWLLDSPWPRLPEGDRHNESKILGAQMNAATELLNEVSIKQIIEFSLSREFPGVLGNALGRVVDDQQDVEVLDELIVSDKDNSIFFISYCSARVQIIGSDWVETHATRLRTNGTSDPDILVFLYLGLPMDKSTWSKVTQAGEDLEHAYWARVALRPRPKDNPDLVNCVEKLLWVDRPFDALELAGDPESSIPTPLLMKVLKAVLNADEGKKSQHADAMFTFYLKNIFGKLHRDADLSIDELARIEWPFASLFNDFTRGTSHSLAIHKVLQKDPLTFAEMVSLIYKSDTEKEGSPEEQEGEDKEKRYRLARNAKEVLDSWRLFPGLLDSGELDEKSLNDWVDKAIEKCAETGHSTGCDLQLSEMLAHAPIGSDQVWPHETVRDLLERLKNPIIEKHIPIGIYNSRGVTSRAVGEGGKQERDLSKMYRQFAASIRVKWPRTSAMLTSIAESYEADAKRMDTEADLDRFQWD